MQTIMKQIVFILIAVMTLAVGACEREMMTYKGESGIYFDYHDISLDTVSVAWGLKASDVKEQQVRLKVCLLGDVADYDRYFSVGIVTEPDTLLAEENVEYRPFPLEHKIPAGANETYIEIDALRSAVLTEQPRNLTVKLIEGPELGLIYSREYMPDTVTVRRIDTQRVLKMTENFPQPAWWGSLYDCTNIFGTYSTAKAIVICDVMGIDRELWSSNSGGVTLGQGYLRYCGQYVHKWLQDNPRYEADGSPMKMGIGSQV